ncbi:hypothetical protein conserved [Leishmania donovani]|uniref:Hypothetical_protein_conserved n=1 Tax=Leishmania donovani TaxID=5661 RepID=A0A6J8FLJ4_LEIDO|nr:hypothetical protein conserved [Leishmania donovani]VDZ48130.1 hypothetical_protein_conserved [Leishmania donovani]
MLFSSQRQGPGCVPDRHRRHSQALETPKDVDLQPWRITSTMTQHQKPSDTSSSSSSNTRETEASRKNSGVTAPPQLLRLEGSGRVSPRPREPSSIPLAASARQPTGGRLEPLGRAVSCDSAPAAPASSYPLRVGTSKTLDTTSFDRIVFTPAASAPTYFCDTSTESGAGTASFFLREPVLAKPSSLNVGQNVASGGSPRAAWPLSWRGAPGDCGRSTGDAPHADQALRSGEPMAQVCRSSSATRQSSSSVASDRGLLSPMRVSPQGPGMPAAGAAHHATAAEAAKSSRSTRSCRASRTSTISTTACRRSAFLSRTAAASRRHPQGCEGSVVAATLAAISWWRLTGLASKIRAATALATPLPRLVPPQEAAAALPAHRRSCRSHADNLSCR